MAGTGITISTDKVTQVADNLDSLNRQLTEELNETKAAIDSLRNVWSGEAADATISSYDEFASKFFQNYQDVITQYVKFLKTNIAQGYFDVETQNVSLADAFK